MRWERVCSKLFGNVTDLIDTFWLLIHLSLQVHDVILQSSRDGEPVQRQAHHDKSRHLGMYENHWVCSSQAAFIAAAGNSSADVSDEFLLSREAGGVAVRTPPVRFEFRDGWNSGVEQGKWDCSLRVKLENSGYCGSLCLGWVVSMWSQSSGQNWAETWKNGPAPHSSSVLILCKIGLSCQTGQRPNFCTVPDDEGYPAMLFLHGENKVQLWWSPFLANLVRGERLIWVRQRWGVCTVWSGSSAHVFRSV